MEISSGNLKEDRALGYIEVAIAHLIKEDKLSFIQSRALSSLVEIVANYITKVGEEATRFAEHGHRTKCKPIDILRALESLGRPLDLTILKEQGSNPFGTDALLAPEDAASYQPAKARDQQPLPEQQTITIPPFLPRFPDLQVRKRTIDLLDALSNANFTPDDAKRTKTEDSALQAKCVEQQLKQREEECEQLRQKCQSSMSFSPSPKEGQHFTEEDGAVQSSETVFEQCAVLGQNNLL